MNEPGTGKDGGLSGLLDRVLPWLFGLLCLIWVLWLLAGLFLLGGMVFGSKGFSLERLIWGLGPPIGLPLLAALTIRALDKGKEGVTLLFGGLAIGGATIGAVVALNLWFRGTGIPDEELIRTIGSLVISTGGFALTANMLVSLTKD